MVREKDDPTIVKYIKPGRRHSKRVHIRAYKYWTKCHSMASVKKTLREDGIHVPIPTLMRWCEREDWEAREAVQNNELRRILRTSDDPVLRKLVMDDLEYVTVLRALRGIVMKVLKQPQRYGLRPKSIKDVIELVKFLRVEREGLLGAAQTKAEKAADRINNVTVNFNDQRKIDFGARLKQLPPEQLAYTLDTLGSVVGEDSEVIEDARKKIIDAKEAS